MSRPTSHSKRRARAARHQGRSLAARATAIAAVFVAATTLAACGSPGPLDPAMNDRQQQQLDRVWAAQLSAKPSGIPADQLAPLVKNIYTACAGIDRTVAILGALEASCVPVATVAKLGAVLEERCAAPSRACVRALDRMADGTEELTLAVVAFNEAVTAGVKDPACAEQLLTTQAQVDAYRNLAGAYRLLALGVEQNDEDVAALGQRRIDDANAALASKGTPQQLIDAFRKICEIPQD